MSDDLAKMLLASELAQFRVDIRKLCVQLRPFLLQRISVFAFQQFFRLPISGVIRLEAGWIASIQICRMYQICIEAGWIASIQIWYIRQMLNGGKRIVQWLVPTLFAVQDDTRFR